MANLVRAREILAMCSEKGRGMQDLNTATIRTDGSYPVPCVDHSRTAEGISVYFREIEKHLLGHIAEADIVVGCVAWLTSFPVLMALAFKRGVSLIVQKEDFLRPDIATHTRWSHRLRAAYESLPSTLGRYDLPVCSVEDCEHRPRIYGMSCCSDPTIEAVRCVGNHNTDKQPAFPRMHHKFILLCRELPDASPYDGGFRRYEPYAVWTGSFNFTANAGLSLENALFITLPVIVHAYWHEWGEVSALSEPLDWDTPWMAPEWRLGT